MPVLSGLTSGTDSTDGTQFTTASVSPTGNRLLLLAVLNSRGDTTNADVPSAVTGNGLTWVQVAAVQYDTAGATRSTLSLWRAMGAAPSSGVVTITCPNTQSSCSWSLVQSDSDVDTGGTNGSAAIVQSVTNSSAADADGVLVVTLAAFADAANATYGCFAVSQSSVWTAGSGFTEIHDVAQAASPASTLLAEYKDANDTSVDASTASTGIDLGGIAVEIAAAPPSPVNVNPATISGTATVGQTLTLTDGDGAEDWTGETSIARQWQRADDSGFTTNVVDVGGATATTYVLVTADTAKYARCRVRATNAAGSTDSNSNVLGPVAAPNTATVTGGGLVTVQGFGPDYDFDVWLSLPTSTSFRDRLRSFGITRGRTSNLERMNASTANVELKNGDGAPLDPGNASSPHYGDVIPLREMALARRHNGVRYDRFKGYVERFKPEWVPPDYQSVNVDASDVFEGLSSIALFSDTATLQTTLAGANNDLIFSARVPGGRGDDISVEYVVAGNNTSLDVGTNAPLGEATQMIAYVTASLPPAVAPLLDYFGGQPAAPVGASELVTIQAQGTAITITVATGAGGAATSTAAQVKAAIEADPAVSDLVTVALAFGNDGSGVVAAFATTNLSGGKWPQELTGERINRVLDFLGWPAGLRRVDAGLFEIVTQGFTESDRSSALSHLQDVAASELGYCFIAADGYFVYHDGGHRARETRSTVSQVLFSDDASDVDGFAYISANADYSKESIYNRVSVTAGHSGAEPQIVEDTDSQLLYSPVAGVPIPRDYSRATLLALDDDAMSLSVAILAAHKDARVRFENITVLDDGRYDVAGEGTAYGAGVYGAGVYGGSSGSSYSSWPAAVLGRELADRVSLRITPPGHTTTATYAAFVEQITDAGQPGHPLAVTFTLSDALAMVLPVPPVPDPDPPVALQVRTSSTAETTEADPSLTFSATCEGSNRYLLVGIQMDWDTGSKPTVATVTFNGTPMSFVAAITEGADVGRAELWQLISPPAVTGDVTITLSGGLSQDFVAIATPFSGVHQTTPRGSPVSATGTGTAAEDEVLSATGEIAFGLVGSRGPASASGAGQTRRETVSVGFTHLAHDTEAGAANVTLSWTLDSSEAWGVIAASVKPN